MLILLLCGLPGCGREASGQMPENREMDIIAAEVIPFSVAQHAQETEALLESGVCVSKDAVFPVDEGNIGEKADLPETIICNGDSVFSWVSYSEPMAQYPYRNQLYSRQLQQEEPQSLIYDTSEAYWINEVTANDDYLYWVEAVSGETDVCLKVMQYQLEDGAISCIAQREAADTSGICLAVSERFLTWYDSFQDDRIEIVVYDIEKQEFREADYAADIPGGSVAAPRGRLEIVEDCITYFLEDEQGQLYIRRENLCTGQRDTLLLGDRRAYPKLAGCFSDGRYIGWYTEYGWGSWFIYDMDSEKLYSWDVKEDGMYVFSTFFADGKLFINNRNNEDNGVYVWNPASGQVYRQDLGDGCGMRFRQYREDSLTLEVRYEDRVELIHVCSDNLTSVSLSE